MKILIVSGFLGAGKTTFIKELVKKTGKEIAILENEYAGAGIDKDVLSTSLSGNNVNIWEMTEGCICCSASGDFAASVLTVANAVDPEYLIVEPTGAALLSNVISNIKKILYERIALLAPVAIVDAQGLLTSDLARYGEIFTDQIKAAHTVLLSKTEQMDESEIKKDVSFLDGIVSDIHIETEHYTKKDKAWWLKLLSTGYDGSILKDSAGMSVNTGIYDGAYVWQNSGVDYRADDDTERITGGDTYSSLGRITDDNTNADGVPLMPETFSLEGVTLDSPEALILLLENCVRGAYGDIIRAKGYVNVPGDTLRFEFVNGRWSVTGYDDEKNFPDEEISQENAAGSAGENATVNAVNGKAVFIGMRIKRQAIRKVFFKSAPVIKLRKKYTFEKESGVAID